MKRKIWVSFLLAISVLSIGFVFYRQTRAPIHRRLNVFVVSFCSFRMQLLSRYGGKDPELLPAMEEFMKKSSFIFDNVYNELPWTGVFTYTRMRIPYATFADLAYHFLGSLESGHLERIPNRRSYSLGKPVLSVNDNDFEKDHGTVTDYLGELTRREAMQPFFGVAHYKYLHYPLIDRFNADSGWDRFLTGSERRLISEYLNHPGKYPEKLPFLMLLANDPKIALAHPEIQRLHWKQDTESLRELTGLLTNARFLKRWKESAGYRDDMELLEKVYSANAKYLDQVIAPALNLWGDKELQANTVVIMMADHGEMHMERDQLTHGGSLYDEALRVPMAIHFPGHSGGPTVIKDQMHFVLAAKLMEGIMKGEIFADNLPREIAKLQDDVEVLRDCLNTQRGLRVKNKYKYFVRIADGERFLYDLEKDPGELTNIAPANPELADNMEALYWENYPRFSDLDPYHCAPWSASAKNTNPPVSN